MTTVFNWDHVQDTAVYLASATPNTYLYNLINDSAPVTACLSFFKQLPSTRITIHYVLDDGSSAQQICHRTRSNETCQDDGGIVLARDESRVRCGMDY
jgi:hypothetical protein